MGNLFLKFADSPWWLRWPICLGIVAIGLFTSYWILAVGAVLTVTNIYFSLNDILDKFMPRRGHDE
ncbi:MAG: hypothetical protein L3J82_07645 [Planctomycetes bacterium]|nr:hypothetical protein [Planctomycetota bacterium]